jgi:hypothetical protein
MIFYKKTVLGLNRGKSSTEREVVHRSISLKQRYTLVKMGHFPLCLLSFDLMPAHYS